MHARWQVLDKNGDEGHRKNNKRINQGRWKGSVPKAQRAGRGMRRVALQQGAPSALRLGQQTPWRQSAAAQGNETHSHGLYTMRCTA